MFFLNQIKIFSFIVYTDELTFTLSSIRIIEKRQRY